MSAWEDVLLDSGDQRKPAEWWWAYVTDVAPLRIRRELETHPLGSTPSTLIAGLEIGDKVRVVNYLGQALVVGRAGGPPAIARGNHFLQIGDDGAPRLYSDAGLVFGRGYTGNAPGGSTNRLMVVTPVGTIGALADVISHQYLPIKIASGRVSIAAGSNGIGSASVTFPSGLFTAVPRMSVTADSAATTVVNAQFSGTTTSGTTLYLQRSNTINTGVEWVAVQA